LLVDAAVAAAPAVVIGSGIRGSKLALPGELAARLPGAEVVEGLAR
jgi:prolyl-tRNA editing enzyme YbaK/EbsC (Cys-tRNA(Pro) deacylase)